MRSSCREDILGRLDALHDVVSELLELSFDALTTIRDRRTVAAMAQRAGQIGAGYAAVIRRFVQQLPEWVDAATRDKASSARTPRHYGAGMFSRISHARHSSAS
jgi:hypothetical protein